MTLTLKKDTSRGGLKRLSLISELGSTNPHLVAAVGVVGAIMTFVGEAGEDAVAALGAGKILTGIRPLLLQILRIRMISRPLAATETQNCW
jgi:hypothetical protein